MSKSAIEILKRSIENLKGEALRKQREIEEIDETKAELVLDIEMLIKRVDELDNTIKQLEGNSNE